VKNSASQGIRRDVERSLLTSDLQTSSRPRETRDAIVGQKDGSSNIEWERYREATAGPFEISAPASSDLSIAIARDSAARENFIVRVEQIEQFGSRKLERAFRPHLSPVDTNTSLRLLLA